MAISSSSGQETCPCKILIITAMKIEAEPFIVRDNYPAEIEKNIFCLSSINAILSICGIGKNSADRARYAAEKFKPLLALNIGSCGALNTEYAVGEIFHIDSIFCSDRKNVTEQSAVYPMVLKGFKNARLVSSARPLISPEERNSHMQIADLVDMEAYYIAAECESLSLPFYSFKIVSDTRISEPKNIIENIKNTAKIMNVFTVNEIIPLISR
jgi:nucleoside phosphorylase